MTIREADLWRVAALSMMTPDELAGAFGKSVHDATPWVIAAARLGIVEAQIRLGRMLLSGEGIAKDERAASEWFVRAAEKSHPEAQNMLGRCCEHGWGVRADAGRAAHWYTLAAETGDAWAQYNLGHLLLDGNGVARDPALAYSWYRRSADQGHPRAMNLVGRCFEEGWGVARDERKARDWYRRSAEGGYFRGAFNYASTLGADGRHAEASHWYARALELAPEDKRVALIAAWRRVQRDRPAAPHALPRALEVHVSSAVRRHSP